MSCKQHLRRAAMAAVATVCGAAGLTGSASAQWFGDPDGYRRPSWGERYYSRRYAPQRYDRGYGYGRADDPFADANRRVGRERSSGDNWDDEDDRDVSPARLPRRSLEPDDEDPDVVDRRSPEPRDEGEPADEVASGGERPEIEAKTPASIPFPSEFKPGSIVIDQSRKQLYFVLSDDEALRYPISVGREGFAWTGTEAISRIADWPDWHPPAEMRERDPKLPKKMTGGIRNPLGAKAIYLGQTLYRIHGTNDPKSIGRAASSGCFRMMNEHVVHLASLVQVGAEVHVLAKLPVKVADSVR